MSNVYLCVTNDLQYDQRIMRMASALHDADYEIFLVGRKWGHTGSMDIPFQYKLLSCWLKSGPLFYVEFNIRLWFFLARRKIDILVSNDADTLLACGLRTWGDTQLVYDSHEWFTEVPELLGKPLKRRLWYYLQRWMIPKAALCLSVGPKLCRRLSNLFQAEFHSIRNMPIKREFDQMDDIPKASKPVMIYQGALNEGRGIREGILALKDLTKWTFWIVGEGPEYEDLKELVHYHGLQERVVFYGRVKPDVLFSLTPKAWVGLNLLEPRSKNYYFSLANKFFDYIQAGIPVVTMNFPEYRYHNEIHETSILVDECTEQQLVQAIRQLENQTTYDAFKKQCAEARSKWNWEEEKSHLLELYNSIDRVD